MTATLLHDKCRSFWFIVVGGHSTDNVYPLILHRFLQGCGIVDLPP